MAKVVASPLATSGSRHSALADIGAGRRSELTAILGPMLEDALDRGIPMPATRTMHSALMGLEQNL